MVSFLRIVKFAFQDIGRNLGLSCMTVFILILMALSLNALWSLNVITTEAVALAKDQVNMSLYLNANIEDKDLASLKSYIQSFPETTNIQVVSRDSVLANFKDRHRLNQAVLDALKELGGNPFGPTIVIKAREPEDYKKISTALDVPEYQQFIESKSFAEHDEALTQIQNITNRIERLGFGLTALFAVIAFLIIFNTVRVAITTQRVEIGIKRLVGANNWFIRGPYLVESVIFTLLSIGVTIGVVFIVLRRLDPYLSVVFPNGFSLTNYYNSHILYLFGTQALAVLFLTVISSSLAMRRQLKV